jgi:radical SAM protein with 4Fe4S-binding SPASM domain
MREMTLESWISVIDYLKKLYNPFFVITGGEPTVSDKLIPISAHLNNINSPWGLVTNGFSLSKELLTKLENNGLYSITLSIDGLEDSHKYIRRHPKSWENALNTLEYFSTSKIPIRDVVTCVYPNNITQLKEIGDILINYKINNWRFFRIFPKGSALKHPELFLSTEQSRVMLEFIKINKPYYKQNGLNLNFSCEGYLPMDLDSMVRETPFFCRAGINIASILADGTITGCNNNGPDFYQGNVSTDNFKEIWEKSFKEFRDRSWLKTGACKDCKEWKSCQGSSIHLREKSIQGPKFCYLES